jgi:hypothetical protein
VKARGGGWVRRILGETSSTAELKQSDKARHSEGEVEGLVAYLC